MNRLSPFDRRLIAATRNGLPLVTRPFDAVGAALGVSGEVVRERLAGMQREGLLRRVGAALNRERLGFVVSALAVWDVDDTRVDELGIKVGAIDRVSHCHRRPRRLPQWPYNLFALVHGASRAEAERVALQILCLLADASRGHDLLFRTAVLKHATAWQPPDEEEDAAP